VKRLAPLLLAIAAFAAIGLVWIIADQRASERVYDDFSSANTSDTGVSQASAYLARRGKSVMLMRTLGRDPIEPNAVVFRLVHRLQIFFDPEDLEEGQFGPARPRVRALLSDAEDAFVRRGGRIIVGAHLGALDPTTPKEKTAKKVFPIWPGVETLAVPELTSAFLTLRPRMHAVFVSGNHAVLARERIGDGELYVLAWPEVFQNKNLAKEHHLTLLAALAGRRPVYFDEVPHGIIGDDGALALMADWNLGPFLVLLCVVAALLFWRGSRRVGPPEEDYRETRSDAVDLVQSLAALYADVTTEKEALTLYHDALTRTVAHTSGLRGAALRARVDDLTGGRRTLDAINEGFMKMQSHSLTASKSHRAPVRL
jgi:hypothetical protein